jgi:hypothetical protein
MSRSRNHTPRPLWPLGRALSDFVWVCLRLIARDANNLAGVLKDLGDGFSAREALDWSLSIYTKVLGPDHPTTRTVARNRAGLD